MTSVTPSEPMSPSIGMGVLHLFCKPEAQFDREATVHAVKAAEAKGLTVITVSMLGHKYKLRTTSVVEWRGANRNKCAASLLAARRPC